MPTSRRRHIAAAAAVLAAHQLASTFAAGSPDKAGSFGVGLGTGTGASGLSAKYNLTDGTSIQANVGTWGSDYTTYGGLALSADYLLMEGKLAGGAAVQVNWNLGVGLGAAFWADTMYLAGAGVAGLEFNLRKFPIDVVLEARPIFSISPSSGFGRVAVTGHLRYWL